MESEGDLQSDSEEGQEPTKPTGLLSIDGGDSDDDDGYVPPTTGEGQHLPVNTDTQQLGNSSKDVWGDNLSDTEKAETQVTKTSARRTQAGSDSGDSGSVSDKDGSDNENENFQVSDSDSDAEDNEDYGSGKKEKKSKKKHSKSEKGDKPEKHRKTKEPKERVDDSNLGEDLRDIFKPQSMKYVDTDDKEILFAQADQILNEMDQALKADSNSHNRGNSNSFERIKFLKRLDKLTTNKDLLKALTEHNLLSYCEAYLLPYEDGTFPLYSIRMDVIKILEKVRKVNAEDLKGADGKGQLLMVLQNPPELHDKPECPLCKRSLALITKWKRIIVGANEVTTYVPEDVRDKMARSSEAVAPFVPAFNQSEQELSQAMAAHRRAVGPRLEYTPMEVFIDKPKLKRKKGLPTATPKRPTSEAL